MSKWVVFGFYFIVMLITISVSICAGMFWKFDLGIEVIATLSILSLINQLYVMGFGSKWYFEHHIPFRSERSTTKITPVHSAPYMEPWADHLKFAQRRAEIIANIVDFSELYGDIYHLSSCDLFGPNYQLNNTYAKEYLADLRRVNLRMMNALALKVFFSNPTNKIKYMLLLGYDRDERENVEEHLERLEFEIRSTMMSFFSAQRSSATAWGSPHFDARYISPPQNLSILVLGEHVFVTFRKIDLSSDPSHLYIRSKHIADEFKQWLRDLCDNGTIKTHPIIQRIDHFKKWRTSTELHFDSLSSKNQSNSG